MRIAHICPYDLRQPGGVQTHTLALSDALTELGHESDVFAPRHPLRLPLGGTRADLALHPRDLFALHEILRRPHDIIHIQEPLLPLLGPLALLHPAIGGRPKLVVTLHSAESLARRAYQSIAPLLRRLLARADAVICASGVSREIAAPILPNGARPGGSRVIPPCINVSPFASVERRPTPRCVLFVGRDEPRKGLAVLLRAMRSVDAARLVVAGPVTRETMRLADRNATFLGPVSRETLPSLLSEAACAVFPALGGEALGLVLVEAMAAAVPLIASDIDGYRIATGDGQAALLTPPGDADALTVAISRLLDDEPLQRELSQRGRVAAARFDASVVAQQHIDLYQSL